MLILGERVVLGEMLKYDNWCTIFCLRCLRIVVGEKPDSCGVAALGDVVGEVLADNKLNTRCCLLHFCAWNGRTFPLDSS